VRTALAFIGFGFVIARFAILIREFSVVAHRTIGGVETSVALGSVMIGGGIIVAVLGVLRYAQQYRALQRSEPAPMPIVVAAATVVLIAAFGVFMGFVLLRVGSLA